MVVSMQKNWLGHKVWTQKTKIQTDHPAIAGYFACKQHFDFPFLFPPYKGAQPKFSVPWEGHFGIFDGVAIE